LKDYHLKDQPGKNMKLSKNIKKFYISAEFKIEVLKLLLNSILFEKIELEINVFNENTYKDVIECLIGDSKIITNLNETEFKEKYIIKKHFKNNLKKNITNLIDNESDDKDSNISYLDRCFICNEFLRKKNNNKTKLNNLYISSDEEYINILKTSKNLNLDSNNNINSNADKYNLIDKNLDKVECPNCKNQIHTICFAKLLLEDDDHKIIPNKGFCYFCCMEFKWSEFLIKN